MRRPDAMTNLRTPTVVEATPVLGSWPERKVAELPQSLIFGGYGTFASHFDHIYSGI